jgi:aquaporin Z
MGIDPHFVDTPDSSPIHWRHYLIESWGLGTFMVVAGCAAIVLQRAPEPLAIKLHEHPIIGRAIFGTIMALTAMSIVYSRWGTRSGAHLNSALTLAFASLGKIAPSDVAGYVISQFIGGALGFGLVARIAGPALTGPPVLAIATRPGPLGPIAAFAAEAVLAFVLMGVVLSVSNAPAPYPRFTGVAAGLCIAAFITFEVPVSGMSLNAARTTASALVAGNWDFAWIYFTAPLLGMYAAAQLFARIRGRAAVRCARLNHTGSMPCIFRCGYASLPNLGRTDRDAFAIEGGAEEELGPPAAMGRVGEP